MSHDGDGLDRQFPICYTRQRRYETRLGWHKLCAWYIFIRWVHSEFTIGLEVGISVIGRIMVDIQISRYLGGEKSAKPDSNGLPSCQDTGGEAKREIKADESKSYPAPLRCTANIQLHHATTESSATLLTPPPSSPSTQLFISAPIR